MQVSKTSKKPSQATFTIEISVEEVRPFLDKAAAHISEHAPVAGFRPGHATYDVVVAKYGAQAIWEEAVDAVVRKFMPKALLESGVEIAGQPRVNVEKVAVDNPIIFTAEVDLMPEITKLADYKKLTIDAKPIAVNDEEVQTALKDLARMQIKQVRALADHAITGEDLAVIDVDMKKAGVPMEGGQGRGWRVFMNEDAYIPGMKEPLMGMKEGEQKTFDLTFPETYAQKALAGQVITMETTVKEIFLLEAPAMDDAFAKTVGMESMQVLREKIVENLQEEHTEEERMRQERALLELLAEKSSFGEIAEGLIQEEVNKMVHELEHAVEKQGGVFADYLTAIKKTPASLREEMHPQGLMRVKVALVLRAIAKAESIDVSEEEAKKEVENQAKFYEDDKQRKQLVESGAYRDFVRGKMQNKKTVEKLREWMVK